jgi:hypothetical protein
MRDGKLSKNYSFTLVLEGPNPLSPENLDALYEAGCDDALFGQRGPISYADFDRQGNSLAEVVDSAISAVESAVPSLKVIRVEPEELVSMAEIAKRTGRSREGIRLFVEGKRGPGNFPPPQAWIGTKRPVWSWVDVASWFAKILGEKPPSADEAAFIAALNGAFAVRRHAELLASHAERVVIARVLREDEALLSV